MSFGKQVPFACKLTKCGEKKNNAVEESFLLQGLFIFFWVELCNVWANVSLVYFATFSDFLIFIAVIFALRINVT